MPLLTSAPRAWLPLAGALPSPAITPLLLEKQHCWAVSPHAGPPGGQVQEGCFLLKMSDLTHMLIVNITINIIFCDCGKMHLIYIYHLNHV